MLSTAKISSIPQQALGPEFPSSPAAGVPPYGFSQVRWDRVRAFLVMAGTARGAGKRAEPVLCGCRFFPPEARTDTLFPVFLGFRSGTGPIFRPAVLLSRIVAVSSYRVSVFKGVSRASGRDAPYPPSKERRNARFRYNRRHSAGLCGVQGIPERDRRAVLRLAGTRRGGLAGFPVRGGGRIVDARRSVGCPRGRIRGDPAAHAARDRAAGAFAEGPVPIGRPRPDRTPWADCCSASSKWL